MGPYFSSVFPVGRDLNRRAQTVRMPDHKRRGPRTVQWPLLSSPHCFLLLGLLPLPSLPYDSRGMQNDSELRARGRGAAICMPVSSAPSPPSISISSSALQGHCSVLRTDPPPPPFLPFPSRRILSSFSRGVNVLGLSSVVPFHNLPKREEKLGLGHLIPATPAPPPPSLPSPLISRSVTVALAHRPSPEEGAVSPPPNFLLLPLDSLCANIVEDGRWHSGTAGTQHKKNLRRFSLIFPVSPDMKVAPDSRMQQVRAVGVCSFMFSLLFSVPAPPTSLKILPESEKSVIVAWPGPSDTFSTKRGRISHYTLYKRFAHRAR